MADQENTGTIITPTNTVSGATPTPGVSIPVLDQSAPSENIAPPAAPAAAEPAPTLPPAEPSLPAPEPLPPAPAPPAGPFQPTIPPAEVPIATLPVVPKEPMVPPPAPGSPAGVPEFGHLQPKVDAHPLFSGAKSAPPKRPRSRRWLWASGSLLALIILAYLAIDSGLVSGASHLPFHVFKQDAVATAPVIPSTPAPAKTAVTDPYAGWKTYCDSVNKECLKYPSDWTFSDNSINQGGRQITDITLTPAKEDATVEYTNTYIKDGGTDKFVPYILTDLKPVNSNLKIVGGYFVTTPNNPFITLVDSSLLKSSPLTLNQPSDFTVAPRYSNQNAADKYGSGNFQVSGLKITTAAQSQAWFNSTDAKQAVLILQSFYYQ